MSGFIDPHELSLQYGNLARGSAYYADPFYFDYFAKCETHELCRSTFFSMSIAAIHFGPAVESATALSFFEHQATALLAMLTMEGHLTPNPWCKHPKVLV